MNDKDLREILEKHNKWIMNEEGGERADLRGWKGLVLRIC